MEEVNKLGSLYLGKIFDSSKNEVIEKQFVYDSKNLTTHAVCVGMTGSGKTGLGIALLEEIALSGVPALIVDPKGDLGNLLLTFPNLEPSDFLKWVDSAEAERKGMTTEQYADSVAKMWKDGLSKWGEDIQRIAKLKNSVAMSIYTPASQAGIPLSILNSFTAPSDETLLDAGALRDRVLSTTSSILGLLGIDADPLKSREHILISTILDRSWRDKKDLDLTTLIQQIQKPPFDKVGVFDTETFFPQKERLGLAMKFNNLLASPGFQAWMEGEPLDIQNLLYTKEGKPKLAVLTIAHLSDAERMFFVTLLLNELLAWMRRQSGTTSLRAVLYMDEIFGYFPPNAMPPSKLPMLTLLKQARAFGLGIILATQNPVDLDYKGLANCGTWFIGKLQTERDKSRVLEGLSAASNGELNTASINKLIAACGSRVFIVRSVNLPDPVLFQTRWTLSYLKGPLTLPQIQFLMTGKRDVIVKKEAPAKTDQQKPGVPIGVQEYFVIPSQYAGGLTYEAKVFGKGKLHFVDAKNKIDVWQSLAIIAGVDSEGRPLWEKGEDVTTVISLFKKEAPQNANFKEIPASLMQAKNYAQFSKSFADYLFQNQTYDLFENSESKMVSKPGESEADFRNRIAASLREKLDGEVKKVKDRYESKIRTLQDKIQRAQVKVETKKSQVGRQTMDTLITFGTTLLGSFMGKGISKGTLSQAGSSIKKAGKIQKEHQDASQAEESLGSLQEQLQTLQADMNREVNDVLNRIDPSKINVDKTTIRPRKGDLNVDELALIWTPSSN